MGEGHFRWHEDALCSHDFVAYYVATETAFFGDCWKYDANYPRQIFERQTTLPGHLRCYQVPLQGLVVDSLPQTDRQPQD
jgi:hypothetical protein